MEERISKEQTDLFYRCALSLMLDDYKKNGITLEQAEDLYKCWKIATIFKNGKITFEVEKENE